ncbi:MAG TPA: CusA/CzcA family heavy metal efflux RND transporter [Stellaceae bacterium]
MNAVIAFALRQRRLMVVLLLLVFAIGIASFIRLNIEAYPDPVPPLVDIVTQNPGQSAEEIERYITIPLEIELSGIPHVTAIRTISLFGLSDVAVQFTYDFTYEEAEQRVINRLSRLDSLPNGVTPAISSDSPIGEIYRYRIVGPPGYSLTDLKTIEDWIVERRLRAVPGIIDVTGWGGKTKTYEVAVDLDRLLQYAVTLPQVLQALNNSNNNVGGQTVNFGAQSAIVRGVGLIHSINQIGDTLVTLNNGAPLRIRDVATVSVGHQPRLGIAGQDDDDDIVAGIVLMHRGEQSLPTIRRVAAEIERINSSNLLPPGVRIVPLYDQGGLVATTTDTVLHNMLFGIVLIFFVQWIFLGDLRSAIVVGATIPFALFFAVAILVVRGESANLLSVGAIDFGLIVDATVLMVENIFRHLGEAERAQLQAPAATVRAAIAGEAGFTGKLGTIFRAAAEVDRAIFFAAAIIIAGFVPLFTMSGIEGHIFAPMAKTYGYAILGGLIAAFTISPALSALLLPENAGEAETAIVRGLRRLYMPGLGLALAHRTATLVAAGAVMALAVLALPSLGLEFLPKLEEGNLWIRARMPPSISLEEGNIYVNRMRRLIRGFPEVATVVSQQGRPDDGTDPTGFFNVEFFAPLKPSAAWPAGVDKNTLTQRVDAALTAQFPGVAFDFSQYLEDNVEEEMSGVKAENAAKLFGNDLATLEKISERIKQVIARVPGITDLAVLSSLGQPTLEIAIDRNRAARYGLAPGDINTTIAAAIGGQAAGNLYEEGSDRNFPIIVRLAPKYRESLDAIRRITVGAASPEGGATVPIPLSDVADVKLVSGASFIYRENQERYTPIKFSVRGRDLGGAVREAQRKVAEEVQIPGGYHLEWVGEFGALQDAIGRLSIVVPLSLALIGALLFINFASLVDALLAASVLPMALIGGTFALYVTGTAFSVSAAIGFVALFGIAAMEGIIILSYFNMLIDAGLERLAAITRACHLRLRPVMMTCMAGCVGLLPAALSTGIGSQVQKPLAIVVVGGILLAPLLILLVLPVLIAIFSRRQPPPTPVEGE